MRILVVEDEPTLAAALKSALEEEGHIVDLAGDGDAGLHQFQSRTYGLVILDWMLPRADGLEVCRMIRRVDERVPILMLTVRNAVADRVAGLRSGADDYLTKPFAFAELLARVEALGRRSPVSRAPAISVADLRLDPISRSVTRGGHAVFLSGREYALLYYMISHAGRTISRDELVVRAWDLPKDHLGGTNLVDVHVRNLRKKLGRGSSQLIRTVRGVGYSLDENAGVSFDA